MGRDRTKLAGGDSCKQHLGNRLRRLLIIDSKKERKGNDLVDDHIKIVGVLEMRAILIDISRSEKQESEIRFSIKTELHLLNQTWAPRRESFTTQFLPGKNLQSEQALCLESLKSLSNIKIFSMIFIFSTGMK